MSSYILSHARKKRTMNSKFKLRLDIWLKKPIYSKSLYTVKAREKEPTSFHVSLAWFLTDIVNT